MGWGEVGINSSNLFGSSSPWVSNYYSSLIHQILSSEEEPGNPWPSKGFEVTGADFYQPAAALCSSWGFSEWNGAFPWARGEMTSIPPGFWGDAGEGQRFPELCAVSLAGCEGGEGQRAGALLRRLGPHGPGLLPGWPPPGPLLQDLQRLHGKDCNSSADRPC